MGTSTSDDAGVYRIASDRALVHTVDFFTPIVDDPYEFGRIASANAISDVYAMGGEPMMAIAILGWPLDKLAPEVAGDVLRGSRSICAEAGVALAGGHSIDCPEPIFGLSVNGRVPIDRLKRNGGANPGDLLFLTKAIGVGILSTAEKRGALRDEDRGVAATSMMALNSIGAELGKLAGVTAMTDVTGFGILGHLGEMCAASDTSATLEFENVKFLTDLDHYLEIGAIPGGTKRNLESYGEGLGPMSDRERFILADPQTSGGLLVAVTPDDVDDVLALFEANGLGAHQKPIGWMAASGRDRIALAP